MAKRTDIEAKLSLDSSGFKNTLKKSQSNVKSFVSGAVKNFGILAGAAGFGAMTKAAIDLGSKISDLAIQLNIGTDQLQVLDFAAREAGVGTEVMARGLRNVQLRTEEAIKGNKSYSTAFETLGINIVEFKKLSVEKKMEAIAKAQSKATDKAAAYNAVSRILGEKAGPALQEVLQNLAGPQGYGGLEEAAKRAGEVMSKETIAKMDEAADKIESFKRKMVVATGEVLGAFATFSERVGQGAAITLNRMQGLEDGFDGLPPAIKSATKAQDGFAESARDAAEETKNLKDQISAYFDAAKKAAALERERFISDKELEVLKLRAMGEKEAADALEGKIESMKRAIEIADKYGISLRKAANLVENANRAEAAGADGATRGDTSTPSASTSSSTSKSGSRASKGSSFKSKFGKAQTFEERERASGLFLAGNDPLSGRRPKGMTADEAKAASAKGGKDATLTDTNSLLKSIDKEIKRNP